jgi:SAM-dependent methyltransferase
MRWLNWKDSAAQVVKKIVDGIGVAKYGIPNDVVKSAIDQHLNLIHKARSIMVSTLLPQGDIILDLGGANCPLYKMGYPHKFKKLYLIDLPPEDRCEMYKEIVVDSSVLDGDVVVKYADMTDLDAFADESVDFVWSGQSIEHVPIEAARSMCTAAYRVLRTGGSFCLDTPNRLITRIHTQDIGGGFVHPEHCYEYEPSELRLMLIQAGFSIYASLGICEMQSTALKRKFDYTDFLYGQEITNNINDSYILFFHCVKP